MSAASTRLLQMASQAFPIGGYSHSQGLEAAVDSGLAVDEASVHRWIQDMLEFSWASFEAPCLVDMSRAWLAHDTAALLRLNEIYLATREAAELRAATVQMGFSLLALIGVLPEMPAALVDCLRRMPSPSLPCVWSGLAHAWSIPLVDSLTAYVWSWAENQVLVAMKSVPIGQSAAQRILVKVGGAIERLASDAVGKHRRQPSNFAPGLAILSSQHETQYSRLFRS